MYRSDEIIQLLSKKELPYDIIQYILKFERYLTFDYNIGEWMLFSKIFHSHQKNKIFYEDIKYSFLNEIKNINGNFDNLRKYKSILYKIKKENQNTLLYLNSLRY